MVPSLTKRCNIFLNSNLDTSNVFSVLKHADLFSNDHLASDCWYFVDKHAKDILSSAEFFSIERSVLEKFVPRDILNVEELVLFKAVDCWAVKECERENLEVEGPVKRQLLGEEIIKSVRFPVMKKDEFMDVVIRSNILTKEELTTPACPSYLTIISGTSIILSRSALFGNLFSATVCAEQPNAIINFVFGFFA